MKKLVTAPFLLAIAMLMISLDLTAQGQVRPNNRLPGGQRGINRPLGDLQPGRNRPLNPNLIKKQQLRQRVMQAIGISPEQRMRMQEIRRTHDDEIISAGRRLRQARQALDRAIMSEQFNEAEVRRATEALTAAQADKIRLDASVRSQVRGVLTADQVQRFHQLQREMRREMREQQQDQQKETGPNGNKNVSQLEELDLLLLFSEARVRN
jgi:Spy/CpxP family protein refolding chaperone